MSDDWETVAGNDRADWYEYLYIPTANFDGEDSYIGSGFASDYPAIVNTHLAIDSPLVITAEYMKTDEYHGTLSVHIEVTGTVTTTNNIVHFVLVEDDVYDGEPNVAREMLADEPFTLTSPGQSVDIQRDFTIDTEWPGTVNPYMVEYIVFVQSHGGTKDVLQVAMATGDGGGGEPGPRIITGPGSGQDNVTDVHAYNPANTAGPALVIDAYGVDRYGVNVAVGNIDGQGNDEIITGAGPGAVFGPHVRAFTGDGAAVPAVSFQAYGTHKFGVNVVCGDIDGDGSDEIITGAGPGAVFGPHVRAFNYDGSGSVNPVSGVSFFAYGTPKWGVNVAAGDIDGDGYDEIVSGAGPGAVYGPHVRGWNVDGGSVSPMSGVSFLAYGTNKFGVNVTCGDIDGDGMDEIVTGAGPGSVFGPHLRAWNYDGGTLTSIDSVNQFVFGGMGLRYGVNVGTGDMDGDGVEEILVGAGPDPGVGAQVEVYNLDGGTLTRILDFEAYPSDTITHGVNVTVGEF